MRKKLDCEIISEDENGNWIEVTFDKYGDPDFYVLYFADNAVSISVMPEAFKAIKELFGHSTKILI